jgi:hypothetical protein
VSALDTIVVPLEPLAATKAWRDVVTEAGGVCTCTGACGSNHKSTQGRCPHSLSGGYRLFLTETAGLLCARCTDGHAAAQRKAARAAAARQRGPEGLFDLLAETGGGLT